MPKTIKLDPSLIVAGVADELLPVAADVTVAGARKTICVLASDPFTAIGLGNEVCFGYKLNPLGNDPAQVRIYAGEVHHGARNIIDVAQTDKVLTDDHQYLWVEYPLGSGAATIAGPSTARPKTTDADGIFRDWLFQFRLIAGVASLEKIGHLGNILIPGAFG